MLEFINRFELKLNISEDEFLQCLHSQVEFGMDELTSIVQGSTKQFRGTLKAGNFKIVPIKRFFKRWNPAEIHGEFRQLNNELVVRGRLVNYELSLIFSVIWVIGFLAVLLNNIFISPSTNEDTLIVGLLSIIGLINIAILVNKLSNIRTNFINSLTQKNS
jgi:hypothetical protein